MINSKANLCEKELKNIDPKEFKDWGIDILLVNTGLSITGKKIKKWFWKFKTSGINNKIKDFWNEPLKN